MDNFELIATIFTLLNIPIGIAFFILLTYYKIGQ